MGAASVAAVIEDDPDIRALVAQVLAQLGFDVRVAATGEEGVALVAASQPVVTTLDIGMPGIDGFETAKRIREISPTYLVMVSARTEEIDIVQGLQAGADDFVTKPFRPRVLRARIEAMLRRPRETPRVDEGPAVSAPVADLASLAEQTYEPLLHAGLVLSPQTRTVQVEGTELALTRSEFDILEALLRHKPRVLSKREIAGLVHGEGVGAFVTGHDARAIEVHVANLRRKLGDSASTPRWIETVRGAGYRLTLS